MVNDGGIGFSPPIDQSAVPFIGRSIELERMSRILTKADQGHVKTVFITGEAGIGKTRLAQEFVTRAKRHGWQVWKGHADSINAKVSFSTLLQVFRVATNQLPSDEREALATEFPNISVLLPGFAGSRPKVENDLRWDRIQLFETFRSIAVQLAHSRPAIVWFDDFAESDTETIDWLHYFVRHEEQANILILATCRTPITEMVPEYQKLYTTLTRHRHLEEIELQPFDISETESLARGLVSGEVQESMLRLLQDRTRGIPLFTVELMRMLGEKGDLVIHEGKWDIQSDTQHQVPGVVTSVISERIGHLSTLEQKILDLIATSDVPLPWTILQKSTGTTSESLVTALSRMVHLAILEDNPSGTDIEYSFRHPMIQEVVFGAISATTSRHLHNALATAWNGDPVRAAYHIRLSGSTADLTEAMKVLIDAGRHHLSLRAYRSAREYLETAVEMADASPESLASDVVQNAKILLCEAWAHSERIADALEILDELCEHAPSAVWKIRIKRLMASIESTRIVANCIQHIENGLQFWDGQSANEDVFWMLNEQIFNYLNSDDIVQAERILVSFRRYCELHPSPKHSLVLSIRDTHMALFDWRTGQRLAPDAGALISRARALGDPEWIYDVYGLVGYSSLNQGDHATAVRYWKECMPLVHRYGMVTYEFALTIMGACGLFLAGDWEQTLVELDSVERMAREYAIDLALAATLDLKAVIYALRGRWSKAWSCTKESEEVISRSFPQGLHANAGHTIHAVTALRTIMQGDGAHVPESASVVWANVHGLPMFLKLLEGMLQIRSGNVHVAQKLIVQLHEAAVNDLNYAKGIAALLEGLVASYSGETLRAMTLIEDAISTFDFLDVPLESAIASLEWCSVATLQQPERAEIQAQKALNTCHQLGAKPFAERAEEILRMIQTQRTEALTDASTRSLTDREREIVSCLSRGLSNKQIAEILVLSPRTVDAHLHKIYEKLDVHSRTALLHKLIHR